MTARDLAAFVAGVLAALAGVLGLCVALAERELRAGRR